MKIIFYGTRDYDHLYFDVLAADPDYGCTIKFLAANLDPDTAQLAAGGDAVCAFVNSDCGAETLSVLAKAGIKLLLMRCAGYNNVDLAAAKASPQLEVFKKKGIEVILMTNPVDEWAMNFMFEYDGTALQNIAKGAVDLGDLTDETEKEEAKKAEETFKPGVEKLKGVLGSRAKDVRVSNRLVDSPALLVTADGELSPQMMQMLKQMGQPVPESKPILEVNPNHPLIQKLESAEQFDDLAQVIFDQALLAEGGQLDDPAAYLKRINALLMK